MPDNCILFDALVILLEFNPFSIMVSELISDPNLYIDDIKTL